MQTKFLFIDAETDGLYGSEEDYLDGRWLGFSKSKAATAEVVVDLGASQAIYLVDGVVDGVGRQNPLEPSL